jgi:prolipoprotein diacylglyceryltransferase
LEEALDLSSDRMLNECILYYQLRREVTNLPNRKLPPYDRTYRKKQKCWVTQRFMLYGFFFNFLFYFFFSVLCIKLIQVSRDGLVCPSYVISQTAERLEITFRTGSL